MTGLVASSAQAQSSDLQKTLSDAFIYSWPLYKIETLRWNQLDNAASKTHGTLGQFTHGQSLAGPQDRRVTTPNNDTLYSTAWLDLAQGPVRLSVPDTQGRYTSVALLDAYSNNVAVLGRRENGTGAGSFIVVGPDWTQPLPPNERIIRMPTRDALILVRILIDGPQDLPAVQALQANYRLERLSNGGQVVTRVTPKEGDAATFVNVVNQALALNPPPSYEQSLLKQFAQVGLCGSACSWDKLPESTRALWQKAFPELLKTLNAGLTKGQRMNGWSSTQPSMGNFGTNYLYRALIAQGGLLALTPVEALYYNVNVDSQNQILNGDKAYTLTLPADMPTNAFWSLSMYEALPDGRLFFSENAMQRYAIGDRTPGLKKNADGSVTITLQHASPSSDEQANWLPTPSGPFKMVLRFYQPRPEALDGRFQLPAVVAR